MLHLGRLSLVMAITLALQTTWMVQASPFGVTGDLMLLVAIAGGLASGADRGAMIGFAAGMLMDLVAWTPLGLSALTYLIVGYVVGSLNEGVIRSAAWLPVAATVAATAGGIIVYVLAGQLIGQEFRLFGVLGIVTVSTMINAALAYPFLFVMRWCEKAARPVAAFKVR